MSPDDIKDTFKRTFETDDGEKVLAYLESRFHLTTSTFSSDPTETAYREGQRTVVLLIKNMLAEWNPKLKDQINE
jgi:hypothetical protein